MWAIPEGLVRAAAVAALGLCTTFGCAHGTRRAPPPAAAGATSSAASRPGTTAARRGKQVADKNAADTSDWRGRPVQQVAELFQGRFPGVEAYAAPGGMVVRVRGPTTILGRGEPLYVIDGMVVEGTGDGLVSINPSDVARIEVLKDAADLAAYGSRAGNGVIRITTKRPPQR